MGRFKLDPKNPPRFTPKERARLEAMTEEEIEAGALSDPDNPPPTDDELDLVEGIQLARRARQVAGLTQPKFAEAYKINVARLRDIEQGRTRADSAMRAYLKVIARDPAYVREVLDA